MLIIEETYKCVMTDLSDSELIEMLVETGYSERLARVIAQWYNSH
jgi:hypothetical protein